MQTNCKTIRRRQRRPTDRNLLFIGSVHFYVFLFFPLEFIESGKSWIEQSMKQHNVRECSALEWNASHCIQCNALVCWTILPLLFTFISPSCCSFTILLCWWWCIDSTEIHAYLEKCRPIYVQMNWFSLFFRLDQTSPQRFPMHANILERVANNGKSQDNHLKNINCNELCWTMCSTVDCISFIEFNWIELQRTELKGNGLTMKLYWNWRWVQYGKCIISARFNI